MVDIATTLLQCLQSTSLIKKVGRITEFYGLILESDGPDVFLGEQCIISTDLKTDPVQAEVIGIRNGRVVLMPYGDIRGIKLGSEVLATGNAMMVPVSPSLLGRVIDAFGRPIDNLGEVDIPDRYPAQKSPINPLLRRPISQQFTTGVKSIDTLLALGHGQRIGLFAGSGVGKSTLMGMIARNMAADINVIALIGERGREVNEFITKSLGSEGLANSVVVVATSDQSPLERSHAALTATTIAEYFRDQGRNVTLMMDSLTRYAMALREVGLSMGEPPTARGFTPSVFSALPKLLERCASSPSGGTMTGIYTVLVEGDDHNDPVADTVRAILDGHIVMTRDMAERAHFPAIDVSRSISRVLTDVLSDSQLVLVRKVQKLIALYEQNRDLIEVGAYKPGSNPLLDSALKSWPDLEDFLTQLPNECINTEDAFKQLQQIGGQV